jgi:hypothetical protein
MDGGNFWDRHNDRSSYLVTKCPVLLSTFAELRKAATSFVMYVRLSVRMEQFGYHWTDFHEI